MQSDKAPKKKSKLAKDTPAPAAEASPKAEPAVKRRNSRTTAQAKPEPLEKVSAQHHHAAAPKAKAAVATAESASSAAPRRAASHDDVARLAHSYWVERGHSHGSHEDDWHRAERELNSK